VIAVEIVAADVAVAVDVVEVARMKRRNGSQ
jgi:hypothetical protein